MGMVWIEKKIVVETLAYNHCFPSPPTPDNAINLGKKPVIPMNPGNNKVTRASLKDQRKFKLHW